MTRASIIAQTWADDRRDKSKAQVVRSLPGLTTATRWQAFPRLLPAHIRDRSSPRITESVTQSSAAKTFPGAMFGPFSKARRLRSFYSPLQCMPFHWALLNTRQMPEMTRVGGGVVKPLTPVVEHRLTHHADRQSGQATRRGDQEAAIGTRAARGDRDPGRARGLAGPIDHHCARGSGPAEDVPGAAARPTVLAAPTKSPGTIGPPTDVSDRVPATLAVPPVAGSRNRPLRTALAPAVRVIVITICPVPPTR